MRRCEKIVMVGVAAGLARHVSNDFKTAMAG